MLGLTATAHLPLTWLAHYRLLAKDELLGRYMLIAAFLTPFSVTAFSMKNYSPALYLVAIALFVVIACILFAADHRVDRILIKHW